MEATTTRRRSVAVIGGAGVRPTEPAWTLARELGRALIDARYRLVCGGMGGVMEAACRGGRSSVMHQDGDILGLLPGLDPAAGNPWLDVAIPTGLGHGRNALVARSDAVVAVGGGAGTLSELAMAWIHDRVILAYRGSGWSGRLADERFDGRVRFLDRPDDRVIGVDTAAEVLEHLHALL